jgi:hypothetical protein
MHDKKLLNPTSDKKFGYFFAIIFAIAALYSSLLYFSSFIWLIFLLLASIFAFTAFYKPIFFNKINKIWFLLAIILGRIFNPIVLGSLYFLVLTPVALVTKLFGRDELLLNKSVKKTYWLEKDQTLKNSQSYRDQF